MDADYALFAGIVEGGSLSAAGRALRLSPAMVSKRLRRLEDRLGAQLVRRTTRRLELTERGARFHADIVAILAAAEAAEARVAGRGGAVAGPLRVTAPTSFGRLHVAGVAGAFLAAHPAVALSLDLSDGYADLLAERIDLAVRITATPPRGLIAERLATSRRVLCAAPAYLAERGAPARLADLAAHRLLAAEGQLPWRLDAGGRPATVDRDSAVRTNSSEVVRELALAGAGIALRSLWDVGADLAAGRLVRVLDGVEGSSDVAIFALRPPGEASAAALAFAAALRAALAGVAWR